MFKETESNMNTITERLSTQRKKEARKALRISESLNKIIETAAESHGVDQSELMRELMRDSLVRMGYQEAACA